MQTEGCLTTHFNNAEEEALRRPLPIAERNACPQEHAASEPPPPQKKKGGWLGEGGPENIEDGPRTTKLLPP